MESTKKIMCLHVLERIFCKCLLVDFILMWNVSELNDEKGDSRYTRGVLGVCPKVKFHCYPQGVCGMERSLRDCFPNAPIKL